MTIAIALVLAAAIIGVKLYLSYSKKQKLMSESKIIERKGAFWEKESVFSTSCTYPELLEAVDKTSFADCKADVHPNFNGQKSILFKSSNSWNAEIKYLGEQDGKNQFMFSFVAWHARNGVPYDENSMNIMLTTVEKLFFSLDPETTTQTQRAQLKTKTKFF